MTALTRTAGANSRASVRVNTCRAPFAAAYGQIRQLGRATGHASAATRLVAQIRARIDSLLASVPRRDKPLSVYHELSPDHYSATSGTLVVDSPGLTATIFAVAPGRAA